MTNYHKKFALYIHVPFCKLKCPYCDFNSYVINSNDTYKKWLQNVLMSLSYWQQFIIKNGNIQPIDSIFFGGGTPSIVPSHMLEQILQLAKELFSFSKDIEITCEANPTSAEAQKFEDYAKMGINRISLGIQSLNTSDLKFLGRNHSVKQAIEAWDTANKFFKHSSFDLIYARANHNLKTPQALKKWEDELTQALELLKPNHVSLYELTIEHGTEFYKQNKKEEKEELAELLYKKTQDICQQFKLNNYEISNYAKSSYKCKHNLTYWHGGQWLGIGPSAHSRLNLKNQNNKTKRFAIFQYYNLNKWLNSTSSNNYKINELTNKEDFNERILSALRLNTFINLNKISKLSNSLTKNYINQKKLKHLQQMNFIDSKKHDIMDIKINIKGRFVLNSIINELLL